MIAASRAGVSSTPSSSSVTSSESEVSGSESDTAASISSGGNGREVGNALKAKINVRSRAIPGLFVTHLTAFFAMFDTL